MARKPAKKPELDPRLGKPLGPTLAGLAALDPSFAGDLLGLVTDDDLVTVDKCRELYAVELLGRCLNGLCYFGVPIQWRAETVDEHPVVIVDATCANPEVIAANVPEFLGLMAYSPLSTGTTKEQWIAARKLGIAEYPDEVALVQVELLGLPDVTLPKTPWLRELPKLALRPTADSDQAEAIVDRADEIFAETCKSLLFVLDEITVEGKTIDVRVFLDVPAEVDEILRAHEVVRDPIKEFLRRIRDELPGYELAFSLETESLTDSATEAWQRLRVALVKELDEVDLYNALEAKQRRR